MRFIRGRFRWLSRTTLAARRIRDVERRLHHRQRGGIHVGRRAGSVGPSAGAPRARSVSAAALTRVAAGTRPSRRAWCGAPGGDQRAGREVSRDDAFVEGVDGVRPGRASESAPAPWETHLKTSWRRVPGRAGSPTAPSRTSSRSRVHPLQGDAKGVLRVRRQDQDLPRTAEGGARGGDREAPDWIRSSGGCPWTTTFASEIPAAKNRWSRDKILDLIGYPRTSPRRWRSTASTTPGSPSTTQVPGAGHVEPRTRAPPRAGRRGHHGGFGGGGIETRLGRRGQRVPQPDERGEARAPSTSARTRTRTKRIRLGIELEDGAK